MKRIFMQIFDFKFQVLMIFLTIIGNVFCTLSLPNYLSELINVGIGNYV